MGGRAVSQQAKPGAHLLGDWISGGGRSGKYGLMEESGWGCCFY